MDSKKETNNINGKDSSEDNSENPNSPGGNKQKRKRRSKNDKEGRSFQCDECGKSYLSQPALTNHKKTKHNYGQNGEKKGRGRPRKNPLILNPNDNAEKKFKQFFDIDLRKPSAIPICLEYIKECLREIIDKYSDIFGSWKNLEDHIFFRTLTNIFECTDDINKDAIKESNINNNNNNNIEKPRKDLKCDNILSNYLKEVSSKTNKEYFHFIFKFVILFRECINRLRKNTKVDKTDEELNNIIEPQIEYTQMTNAESVPDTCNEFITEFMEPNDYFGLDTGELIEIIQHLCFWLYVNNYTTSRLTLL